MRQVNTAAQQVITAPKRRALAILPKPPAPELEPLLTVVQVASLLGKSIEATRKMVYRGELPAVRMGNRGVRFKRDAIAKFLDELPPV